MVLERWACGLSVMLETMFGCALIAKLWSNLLMEANFNTTNKITYGQQMLHQARKYKLIPEEIYSKWNRLADDGTLAKVLFYDIICQTRLPTGISVVDADKCYDQIAHPIVLLVFQALGAISSPWDPSRDGYLISLHHTGYDFFPPHRFWGLQGVRGLD